MSVSAEVDERTLREIYLPAFEQAVDGGQAVDRHVRLQPDQRRLCVRAPRAAHGHPPVGVGVRRVRGLGLGRRPRPAERPRGRHRPRDAGPATAPGSIGHRGRPRRRPRRDRSSTRPPSGCCASSLGPGRRRRAAVRRRGAPRAGEADRRRGHGPAQERWGAPAVRGGRIAVIGRAAKEPRIQGGGSSQITPTQVDVPIDELRRLAGDAAISYSEGYDDGATERPDLVGRGRRGGHGLGRGHRLRGDAAREGIGGRRPDGPGPHAAARRPDPCGLCRAATDGRRPVQRFGRRRRPVDRRHRRGPRSVALGSGGRRCDRRRPVRGREPVGPARRDVPAPTRGHARRTSTSPATATRSDTARACTSGIAGTRRGTCRCRSHSGTASRTRPSAMTLPAPRPRPSRMSTA